MANTAQRAVAARRKAIIIPWDQGHIVGQDLPHVNVWSAQYLCIVPLTLNALL